MKIDLITLENRFGFDEKVGKFEDLEDSSQLNRKKKYLGEYYVSFCMEKLTTLCKCFLHESYVNLKAFKNDFSGFKKKTAAFGAN